MTKVENIEELLAELENLRQENAALKQQVNSRRFQFANQLAAQYNRFFPPHSRRRQALGRARGSLGARRARKQARRQEQILAQITQLAQDYSRVMVLNSTEWDTALRQRSYHFAREFVKLGYFVIYLETRSPHTFRKITENLVTVNSTALIPDFFPQKQAYFLTPNNAATGPEELLALKRRGFKLIYDFLDEFDASLAEDYAAQTEVWRRLGEISPDLYLVISQKLRGDLERHLRGNAGNSGHAQKPASSQGSARPEKSSSSSFEQQASVATEDSAPILLVPNAVQVEDFNYKTHADLSPAADLVPILATGHPIVGFYGALAPWLDYDLLNHLATEHPEWEFVYLGVDHQGALAKLKIQPNVHYLGAKKYEDLPRYVQFFDCATIPFRPGEIARATSPLKLYEYMAAGIPVVCTRDLTECQGYVNVAVVQDEKEFVTAVDKAIKLKKQPEARQKLLETALQNTWTARVEKIDQALKTPDPQLYLVLCVYNEAKMLPYYLKHIEPYVDAIIALDDGSTDDTVKILQASPKLKHLIKNPRRDQLVDWDEGTNREKLLKAARKHGADWVLTLDPDERFEQKFLQDLRQIVKHAPRDLVYYLHCRELWGKYDQYRDDGVWGEKSRCCLFPLSDHDTFQVNRHKIHTKWYPDRLVGQEVVLDYNFYHLKMITAEKRAARAALYNRLDPEHAFQPIGYDYLADPTGLHLQQIPAERAYDYSTLPPELMDYRE